MTLEIQVLSWHMHKNVAVLNLFLYVFNGNIFAGFEKHEKRQLRKVRTSQLLRSANNNRVIIHLIS
jgi:hypothetical protein